MEDRIRVLVVDDDAVVGHSISRVLSEKGYQVRETLSGLEALEELDHQHYDMVFTDIKMPGMDGLHMTSRLKKNHPELPVLIITGYGTEANEQKARDLGVAGFLRKPFSPRPSSDWPTCWLSRSSRCTRLENTGTRPSRPGNDRTQKISPDRTGESRRPGSPGLSLNEIGHRLQRTVKRHSWPRG